MFTGSIFFFSVKQTLWVRTRTGSFIHNCGLEKKREHIINNHLIKAISRSKKYWPIFLRYVNVQRRDTHIRPALEAGIKLAMMLRRLATGQETSITLSSNRPVCLPMSGHRTGAEGWINATAKEDWKVIAHQYQGRWNVSHASGLRWQAHSHQETTKFSRVFYNWKGLFSVLLLALVNADYVIW